MLKRCAITPYEGNKPYIFISYAHKDSHMVFPILEELDRRGFRIWYDDGIAPGSEWPENIAQHLSDCALTMAFISPNSIASDNCRREVTFALSKRKPFLAIILEPTEMSLGMEMQLSAQQCIMKYTYDTEEAFFRKVCSCGDLTRCWEQPAAPKPQPQIQPVPAPAPVSAPTAKPQPAPKPKKEAFDFGAFFAANKKWILPVAGGLVAAVILVCCLLLIPKGPVDDEPSKNLGNTTPSTTNPIPGTSNTIPSTSGTEVEMIQITDQVSMPADATALGLDGDTITEETVENIGKLTQLSSLSFWNCDFQSGVLSQLSLPEDVTELIFSNCSGIDSLTFLTKIPDVVTLVLKDCSLTDSVLPELNLAQLSQIDLSGNAGLTDLSKLSGCTALTSVRFDDTQVSDVSVLAQFQELTLIGGGYSKVTNIDALATLDKLTYLDFTGCGIEEINETFTCLRLNTLLLGGNQLAFLDAFANCAVLKHVDVSYNNYISLGIVKKSAATLETLNISGNSVFGDKLEFLLDCPNLKELYADLCYLDDLNFLANATKLEKLSAVGSDVMDISGLRNCTNLYYVSLGENAITDISPLSGIRTTQKVFMDLGINPIKDLSALPDLDYGVLCIAVEDSALSTLSQVSGDTIIVTYSDTLLTSYLKDKTFTNVYVVGCPADKQVSVEDFFGIDNCEMLNDSETYISKMAELGFSVYADIYSTM